MNKSRGFTVVELIVAVAFSVFAGSLFYIQKRDIETANRDNARKTAINAIYYNLEELYYPANSSYPKSISSDSLRAMDPALLKDPQGVAIGNQASDYYYEPLGCDGDICRGYKLSANLENEQDFIKTSRPH